MYWLATVQFVVAFGALPLSVSSLTWKVIVSPATKLFWTWTSWLPAAWLEAPALTNGELAASATAPAVVALALPPLTTATPPRTVAPVRVATAHRRNRKSLSFTRPPYGLSLLSRLPPLGRRQARLDTSPPTRRSALYI